MDYHDDVLDSRDIIERLAELVAEAEEAADDGTEMEQAAAEELAMLVAVDREGRDTFDDWDDGVTLVADRYFRDYAMELADDLGLLPKEYSWPTSCIDWDQAARELRMDYTSMEFAGRTWWAR